MQQTSMPTSIDEDTDRTPQIKGDRCVSMPDRFLNLLSELFERRHQRTDDPVQVAILAEGCPHWWLRTSVQTEEPGEERIEPPQEEYIEGLFDDELGDLSDEDLSDDEPPEQESSPEAVEELVGQDVEFSEGNFDGWFDAEAAQVLANSLDDVLGDPGHSTQLLAAIHALRCQLYNPHADHPRKGEGPLKISISCWLLREVRSIAHQRLLSQLKSQGPGEQMLHCELSEHARKKLLVTLNLMLDSKQTESAAIIEAVLSLIS